MGCSSKEDYSEQSYDIMATYISQTIMKYDKDMEYKLEHINTPKDELEDEEVLEPEEDKEEIKEPEDEKDEGKEPEKEEESNKGKDLEVVLKAIGCKLTYKDCKIVDNYSDGKYCNIQPGKNKKICILTFDLNNTSGKENKVTLLPDGVFYKLNVEGKTYTALHTIIDNDLHYLDVNLKSKETKEVILIFEVDADKIKGEKELRISSDIGSYSQIIK
jgi:hypothetical protein